MMGGKFQNFVLCFVYVMFYVFGNFPVVSKHNFALILPFCYLLLMLLNTLDRSH